MGGKHLKFKKHPKYPHQRSEGTTRRGQQRIARLLRVPSRADVTPARGGSVNGTNNNERNE